MKKGGFSISSNVDGRSLQDNFAVTRGGTSLPPPLVNIVRPSVSSPTGLSTKIEGKLIEPPEELEGVFDFNEEACMKETDILLPKKRRSDQIRGKLNNKKPQTQSQSELASVPSDIRPHAFTSLFDVSRRLLKRQEPVFPSPGSSPAISAESLKSSSDRPPRCSTVPRSQTAINEKTHLLSAEVPLAKKHRASIDVIPNLFASLAGTSELPFQRRRSSRYRGSGTPASIHSVAHRTTGLSLHRTASNSPETVNWTRAMSAATVVKPPPMQRGFSTKSDSRIPGQPPSEAGDSPLRHSEDLGMDGVGMLPLRSLSPSPRAAHKTEGISSLNQSSAPSTNENPLFQVSTDMLRITGYTNQFRTLLSNRNNERTSPGLKMEKDLSDSVPLNSEKTSERQNGGVQFSGIEMENGNQPRKRTETGQVKRQDTRYGISISSDSVVKQKMRIRKRLYQERSKLCDYCVAFALIGVVLTVVEAELTAAEVEGFQKIAVIDSGADDWRVAITWKIIRRIAVELLICGICPLPGTGDIYWPYLQRYDHRSIVMTRVPVDVLLSIPMFLRSYLLARFMVMHSKQFQDAATRSIAALNRVGVDFRFVVKTMMVERPLTVLIIFTLCYWVCVAWMLTQCDRYGMPPLESGEQRHAYLNSLWLIIVTFMSIGYGDVVPHTYCGRAVAITTGIVGAGVSSALIAVISRKLELSRAEKHVNNFMSDSKLTRRRKNAAAAVLQQTWFIHKYKTMHKGVDELKVRVHQRRFLNAINEFRRIKWDQRKLSEQGNDLIDVGKVQSELHESLWEMQRTQELLINQIDLLTQKILQMQQFMLIQSQDMHKIQEAVIQLNGALGGTSPRTKHTTEPPFTSKQSSKQSSKRSPDDDELSVQI